MRTNKHAYGCERITKKNKNGNKTTAVILLVILIIAIIGAYFLLFADQGTEKPSENQTDGEETGEEEGLSYTVVSSFDSPSIYGAGLAWDGSNLWYLAGFDLDIYKLETAGQIVSEFKIIPGPSSTTGGPRSLTWDGSNLWYCNDEDNHIYQVSTSITELSSFEFKEGKYGPLGVTWDGSSLWILTSEEVYEVDKNGNVLSTVPIPKSKLPELTVFKDIGWDGTNFWFVEARNRVYKMDTDGNMLGSFESPGDDPNGLAWDG